MTKLKQRPRRGWWKDSLADQDASLASPPVAPQRTVGGGGRAGLPGGGGSESLQSGFHPGHPPPPPQRPALVGVGGITSSKRETFRFACEHLKDNFPADSLVGDRNSCSLPRLG